MREFFIFFPRGAVCLPLPLEEIKLCRALAHLDLSEQGAAYVNEDRYAKRLPNL